MEPLAPPTPEAVVATIGIGKFLDATAKTWRYVMDDAARLPNRIADLLRRYLTSPDHEKPEDLPPFDFAAISKLMLASGSHDQSDAIHAGITDPTLAKGVVQVATQIIEYLKPLRPRNVRTTMTGPVPMRPSAQDLAAFRRVYQVADDPLLVLRDLNEGCLSRDQVRSLRQLYPQLYASLEITVATVLGNIKAGRAANWQLPRRKEMGLKLLLGSDTSTPQLLAEYQKTFAAPAGQEPPHSSRAANTDQLLTPGQRHA